MCDFVGRLCLILVFEGDLDLHTSRRVQRVHRPVGSDLVVLSEVVGVTLRELINLFYRVDLGFATKIGFSGVR